MKRVLLGVCLMAAFAIAPAFGAAEKGSASGESELVFGAFATPNALAVRNSGTFGINGSNYVNFNLGLQYNRGIGSGFQAGLLGGVNINSNGNIWAGMLALTWNSDEKINDAYFAEVAAGIGNGNVSYVNVLAMAQVGKRFEIMHGMTYKPSVSLNKNFSATAAGGAYQFAVNINFLQFAFVW